VYVFPFTRPLKTQFRTDASTLHARLPGFSVAVYPVIAPPPSETGTDQDTEALVFPAIAETEEGSLA
jgi:hypothetical protein